MEAALVIIGVLASLAFTLTRWAQRWRSKKGNKMPEVAAQVFGTILCAELFYLVATIERMFAYASWQGCEDPGIYWAGLQEILGSIPATPDVVFWIILFSQVPLRAVMAKIDKRVPISEQMV